MSDTAQNTSKTREQVFAEFHKRTGLQPFGPDFHIALWKVMRDVNSCLSERSWAWTRWRAICNSSEVPVSDWSPDRAKRLGQVDCAIDLAWFAEGKTLQWVAAASESQRSVKRAELGWENLKADYSRAFAKNKRRATIDIQGQEIHIVFDPPSGQPPKKLAARTTFENDERFVKWMKVVQPANFQAWEAAEKERLEARKVMRAAYRKFAGCTTSEAANLIDIKTSNDLEALEDSSRCLYTNGHSSSSSIRLEEEEESLRAKTKAPDPERESAGSGLAVVRVREPKPTFEEFRKQYPPGRTDAAAAGKAYRDTIKTPSDHAKLMKGLAEHKECERWQRSLNSDNGRYIPLASNFISKGRYLHPPDPYLPQNGEAEDPVIEMLRKQGYK